MICEVFVLDPLTSSTATSCPRDWPVSRRGGGALNPAAGWVWAATARAYLGRRVYAVCERAPVPGPDPGTRGGSGT